MGSRSLTARSAPVLKALFDGEDALTSSEEGRTFQSFFSYLMNPHLRARLTTALDNISRRDVTGAAMLAGEMDDLISSIAAQAHEVKALQGSLNRSLRRFIQSREYLTQRIVRETLLEAQRNAHAALDRVSPIRQTGIDLELRRIDLASISVWRLKENFTGKPPALALGQGGQVSMLSEFATPYPIDRPKLCRLVNEQVDAASGAASCAEIISAAPTPLHLAEVAFVCDLALEHGMRDPDSHEMAIFQGATGLKTIELPYLLITEHVPIDRAGGNDQTSEEMAT
jgi:Protein of unknown function (DUF3375)